MDVHAKGRAVVVERHPRGDGGRHRGPARLRPVGHLPEGQLMARGFRRKGRAAPGTSRSSTRSSARPSRGSWSRCASCSTRAAARGRRGRRRLRVDRGRSRGWAVTVAAEDQCRPRPRRRRARPRARPAAADARTARTTRSRPSSAASPRPGCASARRQPETAADLLRGDDKLRLDAGAGPGLAHGAHRRAAGARRAAWACAPTRTSTCSRPPLEALDPDDPLGYALAVYDFLTWLQETLASAMLDG